jgi:hypothetical protein
MEAFAPWWKLSFYRERFDTKLENCLQKMKKHSLIEKKKSRVHAAS